MAMTKERIKELKAAEDAASDAYENAKETRKDAESQMYLELSGLSVGQEIIEAKRGSEVRYFFSRFNEYGWLYGKKRLKDGSAGAVEICVYGQWKPAK